MATPTPAASTPDIDDEIGCAEDFAEKLRKEAEAKRIAEGRELTDEEVERERVRQEALKEEADRQKLHDELMEEALRNERSKECPPPMGFKDGDDWMTPVYPPPPDDPWIPDGEQVRGPWQPDGHMMMDCTRWYAKHCETEKDFGVDMGLHKNVGDTLWRNHKFGNDDPAVYQKLADSIRVRIGDVPRTTWVGNPYQGRATTGRGRLSGTSFSVGVMVGYEKCDRPKPPGWNPPFSASNPKKKIYGGHVTSRNLFFCDCKWEKINPPFTLWAPDMGEGKGPVLDTYEPGQGDAVVVWLKLDPYKGKHRMSIYCLRQYALFQLDNIHNCILDVDLFADTEDRE